MAIKLFAAIDVGSFELELGIYEISVKNGINKIDHVRHVIALGRDTYNNGKISYELVEEMCDVIKDFADIMQSYKVIGYRAMPPVPYGKRKTARLFWIRFVSEPA